jgi:hypothetical protein
MRAMPLWFRARSRPKSLQLFRIMASMLRMIPSEKSATFQDHGLDAAHDPV